jgi:hypothetical protein
MKTQVCTLGIAMAFLLVFQPLVAQENPAQKIKKESHKVINRNIDKLFNKEKKNEEQPAPQQQQQQQQGGQSGEEPQMAAAAEEAKPELKWAKYDFVPGDRVIFEDNLEGEENGEFPSRWDLKEGVVEVAEFGGDNVIMFRDGAPSIVPYFKEAKEDYLQMFLPLNLISTVIAPILLFTYTTGRTRNRGVLQDIPTWRLIANEWILVNPTVHIRMLKACLTEDGCMFPSPIPTAS